MDMALESFIKRPQESRRKRLSLVTGVAWCVIQKTDVIDPFFFVLNLSEVPPPEGERPLNEGLVGLRRS